MHTCCGPFSYTRVRTCVCLDMCLACTWPSRHSGKPTGKPSAVPTLVPTVDPTAVPNEIPSVNPTGAASVTPTDLPTFMAREAPTAYPSHLPTRLPTHLPSRFPTRWPTALPTTTPTWLPVPPPTKAPIENPPPPAPPPPRWPINVRSVVVGNECPAPYWTECGVLSQCKDGDIEIGSSCDGCSCVLGVGPRKELCCPQAMVQDMSSIRGNDSGRMFLACHGIRKVNRKSFVQRKATASISTLVQEWGLKRYMVHTCLYIPR